MRADSAIVPKTRAGVSTPLGFKKKSKSIATGYIIASYSISSCAWVFENPLQHDSKNGPEMVLGFPE